MGLSRIYTKKQIDILKQTQKDDWFILVNHGAKRSGKTIINNDLFLLELKRVRKIADRLSVTEPMYILAGVSSKTIQTNILQELYNKYGIEPKFDKHNNFKLFGVKIIQTYTGTISGLGAIRGMTAYGSYVNEASLANKTVFKEIISRCSGEGARVICDTNPDSPGHWLKTEYIDNQSKNIINFHFTLRDNTFLSERYVNNIIEATPSGVFYDRDIDGLWVSGEGIIYKDFKQQVHYISKDEVPKDKIVKYFCGVDWGYEHFGAIVVLAKNDQDNLYLIREYAAQHEEIDYWVEKAKEIVKDFGKKTRFYCDSARPEHVDRFKREGLYAENANKAVLSGIESVAKKYKTNKLFIVEDVVNQFKNEIYEYVWNEKTGEPVKQHDDVMDAIRYAIYSEETVQEWLY